MRPYIQIVQKRLPAPPLMWRLNMIIFAFTFMVLLYIFMIVPTGHPRETAADLPRVNHVTELRDALREDAMVITLARDGKIFFKSDRVRAADLPSKIRDSLNRGAKPKIYFKVDARTKVGTFLDAFDAVRITRIDYIAILAEQRRVPLPQ